MNSANPGYHEKRVGDFSVTALFDGAAVYSTDILVGIDGAAASAMLERNLRPNPPVITINAFLVRTAGRTMLVDAGIGGARGPDLGHVPKQLAALGVTPDTIDTVLLTHLHVDHAAGLIDRAGGALFPKARLVMHEAERDFWLDDAKEAAAPEAIKAAYETARTSTQPYRDRIDVLRGGEVIPGIAIEPLPGHTPGHSGYLLRSGGDALLIWGDVVHMPAIQFEHPDVGLTFDVDRAQAQHSRRGVLQRAASERLRVAGMHHEFPAFGFVRTSSDGYAFVPELWRP